MNLDLVTRRDFVKVTGLAGAGLALGFKLDLLPSASAEKASGAFNPNAFISIGNANGIQLIIPVPEIGQGIRTSLSMVMADELDVPIDHIEVIQATAHPKYGRQVTAGSQSTRRYFAQLRQAGATARDLLVRAAAQIWNEDSTACKTGDGFITSSQGQRLSYSDQVLLDVANTLKPNADAPVKNPTDRRYIGKPTTNIDAKAIVDGSIRFGADATTPGMHFAVAARSPFQDAKLISVDENAAREIIGVHSIHTFDDMVAVVATDTWIAQKALEKIEIEWETNENAAFHSDGFQNEMRAALENPAQEDHTTEHWEEAYQRSAKTLELHCETPLLLHAPMETPNTLAHVKKDEAEIWAPCQNLVRAIEDLPKYTELPIENIDFHTMRIGGGFGRKLRSDFMEQTIRIAKYAGVPVKLTYTREDDIRHSTHRPETYYRWRAGIDSNGQPKAIEAHVSGGYGSHLGNMIKSLAPESAIRVTPMRNPVAHGPLRAPKHNADNFAFEQLINTLAETAEIDPLEYRLALYGDKETLAKLNWSSAPMPNEHLVRVLKDVRRRSNWKSNSTLAYGLSTFDGYGSHIAIVGLSEKGTENPTIKEFYASAECGLVVNPSGAHAQIEGGLLDAMGAALRQKVTLKEGRVEQSNFHDYPLLRIGEAPPISIRILDSDRNPQGLGELSYPAAAPAIAATFKAATGKSYNKLPLLA